MRQLTDTIRRDIDSGLYDGAVVMVARDGIVACCEALGYADRDAGRAMREDDIFAIFSIAKAMSSMTALQGIERGFYTLRTPLAELVPEFAAEGKDKVTVGHLLTHTGGLNGGLFPVAAATQGDLSVVVEAACRATPSAPPGERVSYSSALAHAVLAEAVRRCDGQQRPLPRHPGAGYLRAAGYAGQRTRYARRPGRSCRSGRRAQPGSRDARS